MNSKVKDVVIVGGGTAGWMVAASLANTYRNTINFTVVESAKVGTVGVGEATIPTIRRFYSALGFSDADVLQKTKATCKLGIQFEDWSELGKSFFHPFGLFGQDVNGVRFHHYWLKMSRLGKAGKLADYSLAIELARNGKFTLPSPNPRSALSIYDWALHFDAALFAQMLQEYAIGRGVKKVEADIHDVTLHEKNGFIKSVNLDSGEAIEGDLFIDCSGFKGLLIGGALNTGYTDWSEWLVCDRAIAVQSQSEGDLQPYTLSKAHQAGWQWKIPLQHRQGNGMVYCSRYSSDDEALAVLRKNIFAETVAEPRTFQFVPGMREKVWNKNCIAVGLAAGFIEPLESTSIALIETAIEKIKLLFPDASMNSACADEFNEMTRLEYERVRDFIILHYKATRRSDSPMWEYCKNMPIPESLSRKIEMYKQRGHLLKYRWEIFQPASWTALYAGYDIEPQMYDPAVDIMDVAYLEKSLHDMRSSLVNSAAELPTHKEFLRQSGIEV